MLSVVQNFCNTSRLTRMPWLGQNSRSAPRSGTTDSGEKPTFSTKSGDSDAPYPTARPLRHTSPKLIRANLSDPLRARPKLPPSLTPESSWQPCSGQCVSDAVEREMPMLRRERQAREASAQGAVEVALKPAVTSRRPERTGIVDDSRDLHAAGDRATGVKDLPASSLRTTTAGTRVFAS